MDILNHLFRGAIDPSPIATMADWWPGYQRVAQHWPAPIDAAIAGGFAADRMAWAFAAGYQAALRQMVPDLAADSVSSICATEKGGNSPKAIQTTLTPMSVMRTPVAPEGSAYRLDGHKMWSLIGPGRNTFLVVAREVDVTDLADSIGAPDAQYSPSARPQLRVVRVFSDAEGVSLTPSATRFVPEATHAQVTFDRVAVTGAQVLKGDGYLQYLKPFRTIEDSFVQAAMLAWLLREARSRSWPRTLQERLVATLVLLKSLASREALDPITHITLAGGLAQGHECIERCHEQWQLAPESDPGRERWLRDRSLFGIAGAVRNQRLVRAWEDIEVTAKTDLGL